MTDADYTSLVAGQRAYFLDGNTRRAAWRMEQLRAIVAMMDGSREATLRKSRSDLLLAQAVGGM